MRKRLAVAFTVCLLLLLFSMPVFAVEPHRDAYDTYNYSHKDNSELASAAAYLPSGVITGEKLGVGDFYNPGDIFIDEESNEIYIADTGNNRIVICGSDYSSAREIRGFTADGAFSAFNSPSGICLDSKGCLFIADTGNSRVVKLSAEGELIGSFTRPDVKQFDKVEYKPKKVAVTSQGDIFIVCEGIYEGILSLDAAGEYQGFVGTVAVSPGLWDLFWRSVSTKKQRESMNSFLPVTFMSIDAADGEFLYAVSQYDSSFSSLVKKINPGGNDVLKNTSGQKIIGDIGNLYYGRTIGNSVFSDICSVKNGLYACTDTRRSRIFMYDGDGHLVFAFGGAGNQSGNLKAPSAIDCIGLDLYVADSAQNSVIIYTPTYYGSNLLNGIIDYDKGDLDSAEKHFKATFALNTNCEAAYLGIGKIQLRRGNYTEALSSFRLANSSIYYSKALKKCRNQQINEHFTAIALGIALLILTGVSAHLLQKKYLAKSAQSADAYGKIRTVDSITFASFCIFHPFKGFDELKREKQGTIRAAVFILVLFVIGRVYSASNKGYLFGGGTEISVWLEIAKAVLPVLLFCVVNWGITTLFDGEGNMRDIFLAVCYALWPLALVQIPFTLLSNILVSEEAVVYYTAYSIIYVVTAFLIIIGNLCAHNFTMKKTLLMLFTTLLGMAIVVFIVFLVFNLWYEIVSLISQIVRELKFRM